MLVLCMLTICNFLLNSFNLYQYDQLLCQFFYVKKYCFAYGYWMNQSCHHRIPEMISIQQIFIFINNGWILDCFHHNTFNSFISILYTIFFLRFSDTFDDLFLLICCFLRITCSILCIYSTINLLFVDVYKIQNFLFWYNILCRFSCFRFMI